MTLECPIKLLRIVFLIAGKVLVKCLLIGHLRLEQKVRWQILLFSYNSKDFNLKLRSLSFLLGSWLQGSVAINPSSFRSNAWGKSHLTSTWSRLDKKNLTVLVDWFRFPILVKSIFSDYLLYKLLPMSTLNFGNVSKCMILLSGTCIQNQRESLVFIIPVSYTPYTTWLRTLSGLARLYLVGRSNTSNSFLVPSLSGNTIERLSFQLHVIKLKKINSSINSFAKLSSHSSDLTITVTLALFDSVWCEIIN